ncbi:uncharacterized protein LOC110810495 [Carica papaya]|uniref:uncharacterized protein LOC110810495 n=1 Tax=Carica papaya TaxID=3649 RepID=UPI000B8CEF9A|nr:uncharacterized protein LOC110810495 [Carica papaya]
MVPLQVLKSTVCPLSVSQSNFPGKSSFIFSESDSRKRNVVFRTCGNSRYSVSTRFDRIRCAAQQGDNQANGEEPPESLFMKELKRRGMTPTSLLEDAKRNTYEVDGGTKVGEETSSFPKRNAVSTEFDPSLSNQRERSMALNSEGLEGLVPRAKLLVTLGGTFFLGFWPLIVLTVSFFSALYLYFGPAFVHDASNTPSAPPQYIDPYALLEDERISQAAPLVN